MARTDHTHYVLGFLFSEDTERVALIKKLHGPADMAGKLNGIGGKVEDGESSLDAMRREFEEEAGVRVDAWDLFLIMHGPNWTCDCYRVFNTKALSQIQTMTDERVTKEYMQTLPRNLYPNLRWLLPLALDKELVHMPVQRIYYAHPDVTHYATLMMKLMPEDSSVKVSKDGPKARKRREAKMRREEKAREDMGLGRSVTRL